MARILTRPMFRKGGLSQTARPSYRGGGVTAIRPGYRGGGMNGIMSGIVPRTNAYSGYYNTENITKAIPYKDLQESFRGGNYASRNIMDIPIEQEVGTEGDITSVVLSELPKPEFKSDVEKAIEKDLKSEQTKRELLKENLYSNLEEKPKSKKKEKIDISSVSDEETMESYMKMFEKAAGTDPDETKRSKWLELAKFGANVLAQPGGDLTGAIGKAAAPSIEGLGKTMAGDRDAKRQLRIAGLSAYLKGKDPGSIGKAVKDIMAANPNISKQDALALALRSGTATRESTAEDRTQKIQDTLFKSGFVNNEVYARDAALALQESVEQGVPSTRYTKLPKDKDDRKDGAYYIDPDSGILGRYNKSTGEIIEPGDSGFKPEKK